MSVAFIAAPEKHIVKTHGTWGKGYRLFKFKGGGGGDSIARLCLPFCNHFQ